MATTVLHEKQESYALFLAVVRGALIHIAFVLIALVTFAFAHGFPVALGFLTLIIGTVVVLVDLMRRSHYILSLTVLAIVILVTAVNVA